MRVVSRSVEHLDPRAPLVVDTHELGRRAGSMLELQRDLDAPPGWGLELVSVAPGSDVSLDIRLESVMDGVLVSALLSAPLVAECGRCLQPVTDSLEVSFTELFLYEPDPDDDEQPTVDGDLIDLEPIVHDAVVLALPLNPLCRDDCAGLCPRCGVRLDDAEPDHGHELTDTRWAALAALAEQNPQSSATMDAAESASPSREN
jgi:uncharacterized protein